MQSGKLKANQSVLCCIATLNQMGGSLKMPRNSKQHPSDETRMCDSRELGRFTPQLETALKGIDRELVHFLCQHGFFTESVRDDILEPRSTLDENAKAGKMVKWIENRVKQDPQSFHTLLCYLKDRGTLYHPIVNMLAIECTDNSNSGQESPRIACAQTQSSVHATKKTVVESADATTPTAATSTDILRAETATAEDSISSSSTKKDFPTLDVEHLSDRDKNELTIRLQRASKKIKREFAILDTRTISALEESETATSGKMKYFFMSNEMKELADLISPQDTIIEVMIKISEHNPWSFFDYELLENLIRTFCGIKSEIHEEFEQYKLHFKEYCNHRVAEVPLACFNDPKLKIHPKSRFCLKIDKVFCGSEFELDSASTLLSIKDLEQKISEMLSIKHLVLLSINVGSLVPGYNVGCIELVFRHFRESNPLLLLSTPNKITMALLGVKYINCFDVSYDLYEYIRPPPNKNEVESNCDSSKEGDKYELQQQLLSYENKHKWIKECQSYIKDPSLSDWRKNILKRGIQKHEEYVEECVKIATSAAVNNSGKKGTWDNSEYRAVQILPTWEEISNQKPPYQLRPNIVEGRYDDWMHYYDIQFRLLREDFISPLRKGIGDYLHGKVGRDLRNVKVYHGVQIKRPLFTRAGLCYEVRFDRTPFRGYTAGSTQSA